jgi:flagellar basal-body rod protein FlgF
MLYGLYLSATGVITSAYRQDVLANNLANSDTVGFKRDMASFYQRPAAGEQNPIAGGLGNAMLNRIGGGTFAMPTRMDTSQGDLEPTNNNLDVGILGPGYFTVGGADGQTTLTRDGRFQIDRLGRLTMTNDKSTPVLDSQGKPIILDPALPTRFDITGHVLQAEQPVAQLGIVDVADDSKLTKQGGSLVADSDPTGLTLDQDSQIRGGFVEHSNVDPATELADLMDTQRQLEANANMIHYQDETLGELVNTVGKVS